MTGKSHGWTVPEEVPDRPRWQQTTCIWCGRKAKFHISQMRTFKGPLDCPREDEE